MGKISLSQFARMCNVTRPSITVAVRRGRIVKTDDGKVETENPVNADYFILHSKDMKKPILSTGLPHKKNGPKPGFKKDPASKKTGAKTGLDKLLNREFSAGKNARADHGTAQDDLDGDGGKGVSIGGGIHGGLPDGIDLPKDIDPMQIAAAIMENINTQKARADINLKRTMARRHEIFIMEKKKEVIPKQIMIEELSRIDVAMKTQFRDMPRRVAAQIHAIAIAEGPSGVERELEAQISRAILAMHDYLPGGDTETGEVVG